MKKLLTKLSKRRFPYEPLITVEISKNRLLHNLKEFKKLAPGGQIAPVLKSNAYGHGLIEIARLLEEESGEHFPFFIVDSYFEAVALRAQGLKTPLLIIGYYRPNMITSARLRDTSFTITDISILKSIAQTVRKPVTLHLKIDTGMHRQGILREEIEEAVRLIRTNRNLLLEGICSHLSNADAADVTSAQKQITAWNEIAAYFKKEFPTIRYIHLSATDGHALHKGIDANVSRLGIGLYGITENETLHRTLDLKPVLEMKTIITGIKELDAGDTVGYADTFTAPQEMLAATIPVGYFEGLDRRLSNKGCVLVGAGKIPCPIIGRISMNITSIDITKVKLQVGDTVVVISNNPSHPNSVHGIVRTSEGSIPYEMVVRIPAHLKRVVVN